ncbi:MAG: hypothetical protein Q8N23_10445 [Archangium sp.]|nr:hypothetical protein [Archangium sp.]MDP3153080.1 hypothetical protein [Archangium sp.]MDP3572533.1 hypothetical protein [Archangium sp.]
MTYSLDALKKNRVSALLYGGTEADRRALAVAATQEIAGAGLIEAKDAASLERAVTNSRAVVYVPDVTVLPPVTQRFVVRILREREERPKLVLGLPTSPETAAQKGGLTEDLRYWLTHSTVDVKARASRR